MAKISVPRLVMEHMTKCMGEGKCLGKSLASLIAETGPIDVQVHNLGFAVEDVRILAAGEDFVALQTVDADLKTVRRVIAPLSSLQWLDFSES